jgi:hypothetical protein
MLEEHSVGVYTTILTRFEAEFVADVGVGILPPRDDLRLVHQLRVSTPGVWPLLWVITCTKEILPLSLQYWRTLEFDGAAINDETWTTSDDVYAFVNDNSLGQHAGVRKLPDGRIARGGDANVIRQLIHHQHRPARGTSVTVKLSSFQYKASAATSTIFAEQVPED